MCEWCVKRINWADVLTWMRLGSIVPLTVLAFARAEIAFIIVYVLAITTDLFDGMLARAQGFSSPKGAEFDGTVDLVFAAAGLGWLYLFAPEVFTTYWPHLFAVALSFAIFFAASWAKLRKLAMPHLWLGKLSMFLFCAIVPAIILFGAQNWMVWTVVIVIVLSRIEMTIFVLKGRTDFDAKSVFF